jgi:signal peptidase I
MEETLNQPVSTPDFSADDKQSISSLIWELVKVVVTAGAIIFLVRYFLFKPFYVQGQSMIPNFEERQYLIIDELTYRFRDPERGEVIVFKHGDQFLLKRVIGLPGERVKVAEGKITIYNNDHPEGVVLQESYLPTDLQTVGEKNITLGKDEYFVLGDNRPNSSDSRRFGPITRGQMTGRVFLRGWPFDQVKVFKTPQFNFSSSSSISY